MWTAEQVTNELRRRGELWEAATGLAGLRGDALALLRAMDALLAAHARAAAPDEWAAPAGIGFDTLARAEYFASFPQWLTAAAHMSGDEARLRDVALAGEPAAAASHAFQPPRTALSPAACYHVYEQLAGTRLNDERRVAIRGTCWRHEGARHAPLERGWAFAMQEAVCLGTPADVETFRQAEIGRAKALAASLGLRGIVEEAADPFFAPSAAGKALLQRVKALKHELMLPVGSRRRIAAASFNNHERFFGGAFDIALADGTRAASGCAAFGVERWALAYLCEHGVDARDWTLTSLRSDPARDGVRDSDGGAAALFAAEAYR